MHTEWSVDIDFRATGPERGSGKFHVWLVMDGQKSVGTSSIYTVGKFDGLGILIDTYGGTVSQASALPCTSLLTLSLGWCNPRVPERWQTRL